jgi:hypothetical protein
MFQNRYDCPESAAIHETDVSHIQYDVPLPLVDSLQKRVLEARSDNSVEPLLPQAYDQAVALSCVFH